MQAIKCVVVGDGYVFKEIIGHHRWWQNWRVKICFRTSDGKLSLVCVVISQKLCSARFVIVWQCWTSFFWGGIAVSSRRCLKEKPTKFIHWRIAVEPIRCLSTSITANCTVALKIQLCLTAFCLALSLVKPVMLTHGQFSFFSLPQSRWENVPFDKLYDECFPRRIHSDCVSLQWHHTQGSFHFVLISLDSQPSLSSPWSRKSVSP